MGFLFLFLFFGVSAHAMDEAFPPIPKVAPAPKDNPMTKDKINLGKQLYFDPRISVDGTVSCNSCHNVMGSGGDARKFSAGIGAKLGGRSSPTVWNAALLSVQFWDGRANTLEDQAKGPMINPVEMGMSSHSVVTERLNKIPGYVEAFKKVFGAKVVTIDDTAKAIAAYERTLLTPNSPFDRFQKGDKKALSASAKKGWELFQTVGCASCHRGVAFAGPELPVGTGFYQKFPTFADNEYAKKYGFMEDTGRHKATQKDSDKHFWRVPTLRNIALTAPYFHNGAVPTLSEAVRVMAKVQLNKDLSDQEVKDLVSFLNSLTGEMPEQMMPRLPMTPESTLLDG